MEPRQEGGWRLGSRAGGDWMGETGRGDVVEEEEVAGLPVVETLPESRDRWHSNEEVASLLLSARSDWLSAQPVLRPPAGRILLYDKDSLPAWKHDGFLWKTRKEGHQPREDHLRLKVKGLREPLLANYVHSALVGSFHRRAYSLPSRPSLVLVHYLNSLAVVGSLDAAGLDALLLRSLRPHTSLSQSQLLAQLSPVLCSPFVRSPHLPLAQERLAALLRSLRPHLPSKLPLPPRRPIAPAPIVTAPSKTAPHPPLPTQLFLILPSQPSTSTPASPPKPPQPEPRGLNDSGVFSPLSSPPAQSSAASARESVLEEDATDPHPSGNIVYAESIASEESWLSSDSSLPPLSPPLRGGSVGGGAVTEIRKVIPPWAPEEMGTEVALLGPWYAEGGLYQCRFDTDVVPANLLQPGVLVCQTPIRSSGECRLSVLYDSLVISQEVHFSFKATIQPDMAQEGKESAVLGRLVGEATRESPEAGKEAEELLVRFAHVLSAKALRSAAGAGLTRLTRKLFETAEKEERTAAFVAAATTGKEPTLRRMLEGGVGGGGVVGGEWGDGMGDGIGEGLEAAERSGHRSCAALLKGALGGSGSSSANSRSICRYSSGGLGREKMASLAQKIINATPQNIKLGLPSPDGSGWGGGGADVPTSSAYLETDFESLSLSDREQRELYTAARVIQTAYRQWKMRLLGLRSNASGSGARNQEAEKRAAVLIQSYYRRYKQYCYFKKLHRSAVLIQKHYREYKASGRGRRSGPSSAARTGDKRAAGSEDGVCQPKRKPSLLAHSCPGIDSAHQAATRIQLAYRGHTMRRRQAAARKIQKFMKESRHKLAEMTRSTATTSVPHPPMSTSNNGCPS